MGISGHILGPRKLRRLNRHTGMNFERAYNRNGWGEGRIIIDGKCDGHYPIAFDSPDVYEVFLPPDGQERHWSSCPR